MNETKKLGYFSHKTSTCGLHFHVNRDSFGKTREIRDERISRVLYFVEHHWEELLKFSRRTEAQRKEPKLRSICDKFGLSVKLAYAFFRGEVKSGVGIDFGDLGWYNYFVEGVR